jgi:hypothetical protein
MERAHPVDEHTVLEVYGLRRGATTKALMAAMERCEDIIEEKYVPWFTAPNGWKPDSGRSPISDADRKTLEEINSLRCDFEDYRQRLADALEGGVDLIAQARRARLPLGFGRGTVKTDDLVLVRPTMPDDDFMSAALARAVGTQVRRRAP